jgi:hypothetical protein
MVLMLCWKGGEILLERYVYTNPALGIQRIQIVTDGIIPLEQIRAWANVREKQNLLNLDLLRIKRDLELIPLIEAASVERILPGDLIIRVREREPMARVHVYAPRQSDLLLERSAIYLDEHGMVIPSLLRELNASAFDEATRYLPLITGTGTTAFRPGNIVPSPQILAALRWLRSFQESDMVGRVEIESIDVSSGTALMVSTEQGSEVSFPYSDFERQLARWALIHDLAQRRNQNIASLDLVVTNFVPAVWSALTNAAPAALRVPQPSPYRKKHV